MDRLYGIWTGIKTRCNNPNRHNSKNYIGKGISICDEWVGECGFENFKRWSLENGYDYNAGFQVCTIDRIDTNGDYEPQNCRWVNNKVQANNKNSNHLITYNGETHTLAEWSEILGITYNTLHSRVVQRGWDLDKAFNKPIKATNRTILYKGERIPLLKCAELLNVPRNTFYRQYKRFTNESELIKYFENKKGQYDGK